MEKDASAKLPAAKGTQNGEGQQHTLRFTLELKESSDKYFPEFSFRELLRSAVVGEAKSKGKEKDQIFPDEDSEDEKLKQLARQFEEKYGPKPKSKKKRRERIADLRDVTYGYDENDPFVDNTEAYDELIPADWTTEHGGFYINQGGLNFRPISSDESDDDFKGVKKRKTPKKLKDPNKVKKFKSPAEKERKRKLHGSADKEKKPKKLRLLSGDKEKKHKKRLNMNLTTSSNAVLNILSSPSATPAISPSASSVSLASGISNGIATPASLPPDKTEAINEDSIPLAQVLAAKAASEAGESTSVSTAVNQNGLPGDGISNDISSIVPKLPEFIPAPIEACVLKLKQAASNAVDGKCKFFNKEVNHMLLGIETQSRELGCRVRSGIYDYLAFYLPCTKETLLKRAKKLLLTDQAGRLREPMAKLKAAVDKVMPEQSKSFEEEVRKHVEEQSKDSDSKRGDEEADDKKKELFKSVMEAEDDGEKTDEATTPTEQPPAAASQTEDKAKRVIPKRKFVWSQELRELLHDVVTVKVKLFEMSKTRTTSAEEYLKEFFESEVKLLWPKGWMTSRILYRESKAAHSRITNAPNKAKKVPGVKKQGEASPFTALDSNSQVGDTPKEEKGSVVATSEAAPPTTCQPSTVTTQVLSTTAPSNPASSVKTLANISSNSTAKTLANISSNSTAKLALKITPIAVSNLSLSQSTSATTVKLISSVSTPASSLISSLANAAKMTSCSTVTSTISASVLSKPNMTSSLAIETVGASTKSESTVIKTEGQLRGNSSVQRQPCNGSVISKSPGKTVTASLSTAQKQQSAITIAHTTPQQVAKPSASNYGPPSNPSMKSQAVTILDFADMMTADTQGEGADILGKSLPGQTVMNRSPSQLQKNDMDVCSPGANKPVPSPQRQGPQYMSPSKVIRSPPQAREQLLHLGIPQQRESVLANVKTEPLSRERASSVPPAAMVPLTHQAAQMTRDLVSAANMAQTREHLTATLGRQPVANPPTTPPRVSAANLAISREQFQSSSLGLTGGQAREMGVHGGVNLVNRRASDSLGSAPPMADLQNNFIDLNAAAMVSHQRQQAAANKALLDAIASTSRVSMNMGGTVSVPLSHPVITRQLSNPTQAVYHPGGVGSHSTTPTIQSQMISMMGRGSVQGKATTPLTHMGMPPLPPQANMLHLNQQQQQQLQFNQVLLGYNPGVGGSPGTSVTPSPGGLQLPNQASLLTSTSNLFQDPTQSAGGTHPPSSYMGRFS